MKKRIFIVGFLVLVGFAAAHIYFYDRGQLTTEPVFTGLERSLVDGRLVSKRDPAVELEFDSSFRHLGGQKFILYGVADTEQHFFVEVTPDNKLKSVYWIQFEAYLPGKPYSYDYDDSPLRVSLGDYEFYTDTAAVSFDPNKKRKAGTDGAMARQFLASHGYTFPRDFAYARLVYLTDESRKKELMIIYIDDLSTQNLKAEELNAEGLKSKDWTIVEKAHLDRVRNTLRIK